MEHPQSVSLSTTLDPLPPALHRGLIAIVSCGLLSLSASVLLFLFLTYRLLNWHFKGHIREGPNQFFILIYNLIIADVHQAVAFTLTTVFLAQNKIEVGSGTCWANGWFLSVGDVASSVFIFSIGLHTFFSLTKGREVQNKFFYLWIVGAWGFVYSLAIIQVTTHPGIYVRAGAWCWINAKYKRERLWLHYMWIFTSMFGTVVIYGIIYFIIRFRVSSSSRLHGSSDITERATTKRAAKYMVIYPIVYVVCTLPLAGGRMVAMTNHIVVPYWYYCFAGAAISSCGWLDVVLYALTRRNFIFSASPPPKDDHALNTMEPYQGLRFYGTTTIIEGPLSRKMRGGRQGRKGSIPGSNRWRSSTRRRNSDEDYFASPAEGVITTKTTVEVISELKGGYTGSETSVLAMEDKASAVSLSRSS